jgi:NAD(P)-dependent dehydrogenase (short-subunit alcohol dehydrogenase family)
MTAHRDYASYPSLDGKGVAITGGATGIGRALAVAFAGQGSKVSVLDWDRAAGEELARELGPPNRFILCDVTQTETLRDAIDMTAEAFGELNVVICNAADDVRHDVDAVTPQSWEAGMAVNLGHQFFAAQAAERHLRAAGGGVILCLGSIAWMNNTASMVVYTTAKAAVHGLVRTLARLWGPAGIRVNALVPGWTMTEKQLARWVDADAEQEIEASQCLPGRVTPEDVARAALFLASADAAMITHQAFVVDGGWV